MTILCIAILVRPGSNISDESLKICYANNPDGMGFTYVRTDITGVRKLIIKKTMDFDIFMRQFKRARKYNPESPFLIHFRIATHGTVNKFNCHPFRINKNMTFIHNGIINGVGVDKLKSDTQLFNDKVLKVLPKGWDKLDGVTLLIEKFIVGSKLLTLDIDGVVNIYNESAGHWKEGVWYSNHSYSYKRGAVTVYTYEPTKYGTKKDSKWDKGTTQGQRKGVSDFPVYYACDGCLSRFSEFECNFFVSKGEPMCYCKQCVNAAYFEGEVNLSDKVSNSRYSSEMRKFNPHNHTERFMD